MWNSLADRLTRAWDHKVNSTRHGMPNTDLENEEEEESGEINALKVTQFLRHNPDYLEQYIMNEIELEQLERWMIRRTQRAKKASQGANRNARKTSLSRWKFCVHADKRQMLQELTNSLQKRPTKAHVLWELANCISSATNALNFNLYLVDGDPEVLSLYTEQPGSKNFTLQKLKSGFCIPKYVARTKEPVRLSRGDIDSRFPEGITKSKEMEHILCQAVVQPDNKVIAIIELYRDRNGYPFHEEDEEISCSYLVWGGIALHYAHLFLSMSKQKKLNEFLLAVVKYSDIKSIFQDMVSMDTLVMKVMNFAQRLVDADRASLFLVDSKTKELYATIFDVGIDDSKKEIREKHDISTTSTTNNKYNEIRFPVGTGIAGHVAMTGEILNITDAYSDPRFNRSVDKQTGYKTESILCMPIFIRGAVIGVVEMINKRSGYFTTEDEEAFETFAIYCGLALHHAKLYDKIKRSEQKYKVALEVLSYHNTSTEEEVNMLLHEGLPETIFNIDTYLFNSFQICDMEKVKYTTYMFIDLFGLKKFDVNTLMRFALTIKKNYRRVPYHNWTHGFSVANTMYAIMKKTPETFRAVEKLSLFIGSLCHDLDHRGKNNKFMLDTESPLAAIYGTSTMEHHHFNQTVTILQQEGHNIFLKLNSHEYKQVLGLIKHCILATDLALFFPNKAKLSALIAEEKFSWSVLEHRLLIQAIAMTASDLSASAKPWDIQIRTVKVIFEEFYQQGDAERDAGRTPIPMMDRTQTHQQAVSQVGFLQDICIPCYSLLHRLVPETKELLDMCQANLDRWQKIAIGEDHI